MFQPVRDRRCEWEKLSEWCASGDNLQFGKSSFVHQAQLPVMSYNEENYPSIFSHFKYQMLSRLFSLSYRILDNV